MVLDTIPIASESLELTIKTLIYLLGLFNIISAAITPGIHPQSHKIKTINIEPQPLSRTASGGQIIESKTLQKLIANLFN